ncbi:BlaI/MecI/CopY family transcriptional regulator [Armatimonas rosea]|uniref:Putative transcriptional regulator n=1 Tax=Armatimonas rosea TaxID=685828 RepID=A0A7W9ST82_ARMRO|nr:BlaI/MecI/CopY family transcriptional regulator [Armatimonas rosea]MBB6051598.1 putative transcriptional regulator [Armatimonas rosea]
MRKKTNLGRAESEVLRFIAERHPISVREVAESFGDVRKTTILNVMERLREKGFLTREPREGIYQYSPTQTQASLMRGLVAEFVDTMLGGSVEPFAAYLAEKETLTETELARLKEIIAKLEEKP